jgi:simple sugar transport system ATP-binding protein
MPGDEPVLQCIRITKYFGGVQALKAVSLELYPGEVVGLVGDNGAGKSTLVQILSGLLTPDSGEIRLGGTSYRSLTPPVARAGGVHTVYQNLSLCDNLGAAANVMLGNEPVRFRLGPVHWIDTRKTHEEANRRLAEVGVSFDDLVTPVRRFSGGQRQSIAIARAIGNASRVIFFDEPTAALGVVQTRATLELIRRTAAQSVAVVVISHNLDEVFAVADRVVALRHGKVILDTLAGSTTREEVVACMTGLAFRHNR